MTPTGNTDPIGTVPDDPATWTDRDHAVLIANLRGRIIESEREDHMTDGSMTDERWDQMHRERVRLQAQIDELAAKVEGLDSHHKARLQEHDRIIGKVSDATDKMGNVLNKLTGTDWYAEPTPPAAPEPDAAEAKWEDPRPWRAVADAYDEAYAVLDDPMNFHDNDARVAGVQAAVAKAIALGLAAPADRGEGE